MNCVILIAIIILSVNNVQCDSGSPHGFDSYQVGSYVAVLFIVGFKSCSEKNLKNSSKNHCDGQSIEVFRRNSPE